MKRGTPRHPKVDDLAARLKLKRWGAVGLLELLWHFTAEFALAGDIGRYTDDAIAAALCYDGPSIELVAALADSGWLDRCPCHRLRVHDWPDHADQTVQRVLERRGLDFIACYDDASIVLGSSCKNTTGSGIGIGTGKGNGTGKGGVGGFKAPTPEDADLEATRIGLPPDQRIAFLAYYESNGWRVGKNPMKNWRAAMVGWKTRWESNRGTGKKTRTEEISNDRNSHLL